MMKEKVKQFVFDNEGALILTGVFVCMIVLVLGVFALLEVQ